MFRVKFLLNFVFLQQK